MSQVRTTVQSVIWALLCLFSSGQAAAQTEWRLLGPAVSWHADKEGAAVEAPAHLSAERNCEFSYQEGQIIGYVCHPVIVQERRAWSQVNPAVGVERITRLDGMSTREFIQVVRDSYGAWGAMVGRGVTWQIAGSEAFSVEAGLAGGLWYRTSAVNSSQMKHGWVTFGRYGRGTAEPLYYTVRETTLERRIVPFLLPLATITHRPSGMAVNVSVLPKTSINGRLVVPTTTVMVQSSFPIPL